MGGGKYCRVRIILKRIFKLRIHLKNVASIVYKYKETLGKKPLVLFQDETRFGRIGAVRKSWAPKGVRPVCRNQLIREYFYVYSAVSPDEGEMFSLLLPEASTEAMNAYCMELSNNLSEKKNIDVHRQGGMAHIQEAEITRKPDS